MLRLTNTYGPRMRVRDARQTFLGIWLRLRARRTSEILVYGDGSQTTRSHLRRRRRRRVPARRRARRDERARLQPRRRRARLVARAGRASWSCDRRRRARCETIPFPADRKSIDIGDFYADCSAIERELGWRPTVDVEDGVAPHARRTTASTASTTGTTSDRPVPRSAPRDRAAAPASSTQRSTGCSHRAASSSTDEVEAFERRVRRATARPAHAVGVASGTDAITIALLGGRHRARRRGDHRAEHLHPDDRRASSVPARCRCSPTSTR